MLGADYNENDYVEIKKQRTLQLRVSYTPELAGKLNTAIYFVMNKLGFMPEEQVDFNKDHPIGEPITLVSAETNTMTLTLQVSENISNLKNIVFHTDDCLRDYHNYSMSGVEFINRPEYITAGLQVNFIDHEDNCYTLLEERNYTES